jgi:hypothetical protein
MPDARFTRPTPILDFDAPAIRALVSARNWLELPLMDRVGAVYDFVRDEVRFGYNRTDSIAASEVLADGYGQCNTKTTLLMALLRALGVPCRVHGATIHKSLQKGVVPGVFYALAPENILHSWAEVRLDGRWLALEGVILDRGYLRGLTSHLGQSSGPVLGYAVGTADIGDPDIEWRGEPTSIQMTGVNQDFGAFDDPDAFYDSRGTNLHGPKAWLFANLVRRLMNLRVAQIRGCMGETVRDLAELTDR